MYSTSACVKNKSSIPKRTPGFKFKKGMKIQTLSAPTWQLPLHSIVRARMSLNRIDTLKDLIDKIEYVSDISKILQITASSLIQEVVQFVELQKGNSLEKIRPLEPEKLTEPKIIDVLTVKNKSKTKPTEGLGEPFQVVPKNIFPFLTAADIPLQALELSLRPYNILVNLEIYNLSDLLNRSESDLSKVKGFGIKCREEVIEAIEILKKNINKDFDGYFCFLYDWETPVAFKSLALFVSFLEAILHVALLFIFEAINYL